MFKDSKLIYTLLTINLLLLIIFLISKIPFIFTPILTVVKAMFIPVVLAIFLYYMVRPIKRQLESFKISSVWATAISILGIIGLLIYIITYSSSIMASQGESLISTLKNSVESLNNKYGYLFPQLNEYFNLDDTIQKAIDFVSNSFSDISKNVFAVASSIGNFFTQMVLIPIIMFYILKDDRRIFNTFSSALPTKIKSFTLKVMHEIDTVLKQYITSQVMVASVIGILMFIGYMLIGMPNALVLALFSLITAFIPYLGVILGIIPAVLIALSMSFGMILKILILTVIVQQLEGNVITPNITGNQLHMHPLTTILVVTISVYFGGFFAAFLAVPIYNILKILIKNFYSYYSKKNESSIDIK
jgi:predicted PurR-regulated permease PerM